ncbi:cytochrome P450, partial [Crucibulum laeve]
MNSTTQNLIEVSSASLYTPIVLVALCAAIGSSFYLSSKTGSQVKDVPSPPGASFFWGHQKIVFDASVGLVYARWFESLESSIVRIRAALWKPDILVISDPAAISYLLNKNIYNYPHSDVSRPRIERLLGRSLGWVEGDTEHKRMRQLFIPSFSNEAVRDRAQSIYGAAETLRENVAKALQNDTGEVAIDITEWMQSATLDALGRFAFDHDFVGGKSEEALEILYSWRNMASVAISPMGFYGLMLLRRFPFLNRLPIPVIQSQGNVRRTIHAGLAKNLLKRNEALLDSIDSSNEQGDLLLELTKAYRAGFIGRDELMDHVVMFTISGSETTAQGLSYALWEMAKNPDLQNRLREELNTVGTEPSYDDIQSGLPYLDAVTREVLRLHPPTPYMERNATKDDIIPLLKPFPGKDGKLNSEIFVKTGQTIIIPMHTVNRLNSVWGDGTTFRPDRWLSKLRSNFPPNELLTGGWSNIMTFSDGPRICTGYRFAVFEFKLFLATLIRSFEFIDTGVKIVDKSASTMNPLVVGREAEGPMLPIRIRAVP